MVSATDPYGLIIGFLDRNRYFSFQVAPQLYSRSVQFARGLRPLSLVKFGFYES
jgi:hypothetical protein